MWLVAVLVALGMLGLAGAMFDWSWIVDRLATRAITARFGRIGGRLVCLVIGVALITAGGAILSIGPLPA